MLHEGDDIDWLSLLSPTLSSSPYVRLTNNFITGSPMVNSRGEWSPRFSTSASRRNAHSDMMSS
jgi:hypothetical protein